MPSSSVWHDPYVMFWAPLRSIYNHPLLALDLDTSLLLNSGTSTGASALVSSQVQSSFPFLLQLPQSQSYLLKFSSFSIYQSLNFMYNSPRHGFQIIVLNIVMYIIRYTYIHPICIIRIVLLKPFLILQIFYQSWRFLTLSCNQQISSNKSSQ